MSITTGYWREANSRPLCYETRLLPLCHEIRLFSLIKWLLIFFLILIIVSVRHIYGSRPKKTNMAWQCQSTWSSVALGLTQMFNASNYLSISAILRASHKTRMCLCLERQRTNTATKVSLCHLAAVLYSLVKSNFTYLLLEIGKC
jgi:hypothetical protein